jgi:hypothetical protein
MVGGKGITEANKSFLKFLGIDPVEAMKRSVKKIGKSNRKQQARDLKAGHVTLMPDGRTISTQVLDDIASEQRRAMGARVRLFR